MTQRKGAVAETPEPDVVEPDENEAGEEEETVEPTPEPEPVEPDSLEAQQRKIDNARRKYHADLGKIVGGLEGTASCPICDGLGLIPDAGQPHMRDDLERCPICAGIGEQFTGSLREGHMTLPCKRCTGSGYVEKQPENVRDFPAPAAGVQSPLPAQQIHGYLDNAGQFHAYGSEGTA